MTGRARSLGGFSAISALCLLTHNAVLIGGDMAGLPLIGCLLLSFSIVVVVGYVGHSLLSFREPLSMPRFARYALAMLANLPTAFATIWVARELFGLPMLYAAPLSTVASFLLNYLLSHWAIARRPLLGDKRP